MAQKTRYGDPAFRKIWRRAIFIVLAVCIALLAVLLRSIHRSVPDDQGTLRGDWYCDALDLYLYLSDVPQSASGGGREYLVTFPGEQTMWITDRNDRSAPCYAGVWAIQGGNLYLTDQESGEAYSFRPLE